MLAEVKRCAEAHDIKGLRYIFVDSLDVDPTFEKYKEDYEYCKAIPELFDDHRVLNGIITDESRWTSQYWEQLKLDLMKNFSMIRFEHMIVVARIVYADKIKRLMSERNAAKTKSGVVSNVKNNLNRSDSKQSENAIQSPKHIISGSDDSNQVSDAELQARQIAEKKRELEAKNREIEKEEAAKAARREVSRQESLNRKYNAQSAAFESKKVVGTVFVIIIIVVVVLILKAFL